jgi:hypothetical protein
MCSNGPASPHDTGASRRMEVAMRGLLLLLVAVVADGMRGMRGGGSQQKSVPAAVEAFKASAHLPTQHALTRGFCLWRTPRH